MKPWMWIVVGVFGLLLVYQLFFRYDYYHYGGNVARIDRLTGQLCALPCISTPSPPSPKPTSASDYQAAVREAYDERFQEAVSIAKASSDIPPHDARYTWGHGGPTKQDYDGLLKFFTSPQPLSGDLNKDVDHVFIVCLCDSHNSGWRWEVNVDTRRASFVDDNSELKQKYGIK